MDDFLPATVYAYSTWPKGTPNYWALPAMGDALGWVYRKDWFEKPEIQAEFKDEVRPRPRPAEDLDRAQGSRRVLPGPRDRRQEGLRRRDLHRARLRGHHHGRDRRPLCLGLQVPEAGPGPTRWKAWSTRADAVQGARVLQGTLQVLHAAGLLRRLHAGRPRRLQVGPGRHDDELVRLLARHLQGRERRRRQDRLLRQPGEKVPASPARRPGHLGRLLLRRPGRRAQVHQVVRAARRPEEVAGARRLRRLRQGRAPRPGLSRQSSPFAADFLVAMGQVQDFWQEPAFAELCRRCRSASTTTSSPIRARRKEALDKLIAGLDRDLPERRQDVGRPPKASTCSSRTSIREERPSTTNASRRDTKGMSETSAKATFADRAADATPPALARRVRSPVRPGDRLALHQPDDHPPSRHQHLPAVLDDLSLVHQLQGQPAERPDRLARHDALHQHPERPRRLALDAGDGALRLLDGRDRDRCSASASPISSTGASAATPSGRPSSSSR